MAEAEGRRRTRHVWIACVFVAGAALMLGTRLASRARTHAAHAAPAVLDPIARARLRLQSFERARRRATDFATLPPADRVHGADPWALLPLPSGALLGLLHGASKLVVLDRELHELARLPGPDGTSCAALDAQGELWVGGERSRELARYLWRDGGLVRSGGATFSGAFGLRALASGPHGLLYALDQRDGHLLVLRAPPAASLSSNRTIELEQVSDRVLGHRPVGLERVGNRLVVNLLYDHALLVLELDGQGQISRERARFGQDGPFWGFATLEAANGLWIAAGGIEDHPLVRKDGAFGYVDSFVSLYFVPNASDAVAERRSTFNVSDQGVVTPKALALSLDGADRLVLDVSGYASERSLELVYSEDGTAPSHVTTRDFVPGTRAVLALQPGHALYADPLLDAWVSLDPAGARVVPVSDPEAPLADSDTRLGEALFFTTLMAPHNSSRGRSSRFSCEACHFEGYADGRVHYTGRQNIHATTKSLHGLFNNRPHFSRALDPDLTSVAHNEFRVAGKGSGTDPWFSLRTRDFPWLEALGLHTPELGPELLRRALIEFLAGFTHPENPAVVGRARFAAPERRGAELFRDRCERCHQARLASDEPGNRVAFEAWEARIFSAEGPLVWATADYQKTGVEPYVHERGTRVPSLRRLYEKWPYFTNGSARSLRELLQRARFGTSRFFHDGAPSDPELQRLTPEQIDELLAFLELL